MIWNIDPAHSHVSFALQVARVTTTRGSFNVCSGRMYLDEQHPESFWVEAEVEAASINTRNRLRDAHLRTAKFFDVKQYPRITFRGTHIEQVGDQEYHVTGTLSLHGITRPITLYVVAPGLTANGVERAHPRASAIINRNDFGVGQGIGVRLVASALVTIEVELEMVRQAVEAQAAVALTQ